MSDYIPETKLKDILTKITEQSASMQPKSCQEIQKWLLEQFEETYQTEQAYDSNKNQCSLEDFGWFFIRKIHDFLDVHTRPIASVIATDVETQKCQTPNQKIQLKSRRSGAGSNLNKSFNDSSHFSERSQDSFTLNSTPIQNMTGNSSFAGNSYETTQSLSYSLQSSCSTPLNKLTPNQLQFQQQFVPYQQYHFQTIVTHQMPVQVHQLPVHQISPQIHQVPHLQTLQLPHLQNHQLIHPQPLQISHAQTPLVPHPQTHQSQSHYQRGSGNNFNSSLTSTPTSGGKQRLSGGGGPSSTFCLGDFIVNSPAMNNRLTKKKANQHNTSVNESNQDKPKKRVQIKTVQRSLNLSGNNNSTPILTSSNATDVNTSLSLGDLNISDKPDTIHNSDVPQTPTSPLVRSPNIPSTVAKVPENVSENVTVIVPEKKVDMSTVSHKALLQNAAIIYSFLLDMNFSINILYELAFLLSILNLHQTEISILEKPHAAEDLKKDILAEMFAAFRTLPNALFFTFCVLHYQKRFLAVMDIKSLTAILQIEGIILSNDLKLFIENVVQRKNQLIRKSNTMNSAAFSVRAATTSFNTVYFQEEKDSRQCFPTNNDFGAFKAQRDLFYETLKAWENKHLSPSWNYTAELKPKIMEIFRQSENLVNMTHLAQLFVSQLISSALEATTPEEIGLKLDAEKLRHLMQRFIVPSTFSSDYQFPRSLEFFREFISIARSTAFIEQLKIALFTQLINLNNSSMEQFNITANENEYEDLNTNDKPSDEYIVRPDVLASMLILAKFLGFVIAQPFQLTNPNVDANILPPAIEKQQIELRSVFSPPFDAAAILQEAIDKKKILITLPWLVQYLGMLDNVSLQLQHASKALKIIFNLYMDLENMEKTGHILPTSVFIIRCCVGWLLEKNPLISQLYFSFRATEQSFVKFLRQSSRKTCVDLTRNNKNIPQTQENSSCDVITKLHPSLEKLINVACPFLQEFRVTIKPSVFSKAENSRSISTKMFEVSSKKTLSAPTEDDKQSKLIKVFLQSQSASNRTMVEYIIERSFKATVRDAQLSILAKSKSEGDDEVNKITSSNINEVLHLVETIYAKAQENAFTQWDNFVPNDLDKRITQALDALLPTETLQVVKDTFSHLIKQEAMRKAYQWRHENMEQNSFYYNNLFDMARKIARMNCKDRPTHSSTELKLKSDSTSVSDLLEELQFWLHCSTVRPDHFKNIPALIELLQKFNDAFQNTLPPIFYRIVGSYLLELIQRILANHTKLLTIDLIRAACDVWNNPMMQNEGKIKPDDCSPGNSDNEDDDSSNKNIFNTLLTETFFKSLGARKECFEKLSELLIILIKEKLITLDFINVSLLPIFKEDFPPEVFNLISNMLQTLTKEMESVKSSYDIDIKDDFEENKSRLLMEVLADFSRDVDNFD